MIEKILNLNDDEVDMVLDGLKMLKSRTKTNPAGYEVHDVQRLIEKALWLGKGIKESEALSFCQRNV